MINFFCQNFEETTLLSSVQISDREVASGHFEIHKFLFKIL